MSTDARSGRVCRTASLMQMQPRKTTDSIGMHRYRQNLAVGEDENYGRAYRLRATNYAMTVRHNMDIPYRWCKSCTLATISSPASLAFATASFLAVWAFLDS